MQRFTTSCSTLKTQRAFSLIEVMVYIGVFTMVALGSVLALVSYARVIELVKAQVTLTETSQAALERITRGIRSADNIDLTNSSFATSTGALALEEGTNTTRFYVATGTLYARENSATPIPLIDDASVYVQSFTVYRYVSSENTELLRITLTATASSSETVLTETFHTGVVVRGTYE